MAATACVFAHRVRDNARVRLSRLLPALRGTAMWNADALFVVPLPSLSAAPGAHRAFAHWEVSRAVAWISCKGLLQLRPFHRPPRFSLTPDSTPSALTSYDFRGSSIVLVVYSESTEEQSACQEGNWTYLVLPQTALLLGRQTGARPLCYTEPNAVVGARSRDGERWGLSRALTRASADALFFSFGGDNEDEEVDFLYPHDTEQTCVYIRAAGDKSFVQSMLGAFPKNVWLAMLATLMIAWVTMGLVSGTGGVIAALDVFLAFLLGIFKCKGRFLVKELGFTLVIFGMLLNALFQSRVTSSLSVPSPGEEIETLKEMIKRVEVIHSAFNVSARVARENPIMGAVASRIQITKEGHVLYEKTVRVATRNEEAVVLTEFAADYILRTKDFMDEFGRLLLHRMSECLTGDKPVMFSARRHSPYTRPLNILLLRALQSGLIAHLEDVTEHEKKVMHFLLPVPVPGARRPPYSLRLRHVKSAFALWGGGMATATAAWVVEWVVAAVTLRKNSSSAR